MSKGKKIIFGMSYVLFFLFLIGVLNSKADASSQDACAIWLCLPGGFPSGCAAAYQEFQDRIRHGRAPLPDLSACTVGPSGETSTGRYELGTEFVEPCRSGFTIVYNRVGNAYDAVCMPPLPKCSPMSLYYKSHQEECTAYKAVIRQKTHFIKLWVNGKYLGQFFYQ